MLCFSRVFLSFSLGSSVRFSFCAEKQPAISYYRYGYSRCHLEGGVKLTAFGYASNPHWCATPFASFQSIQGQFFIQSCFPNINDKTPTVLCNQLNLAYSSLCWNIKNIPFLAVVWSRSPNKAIYTCIQCTRISCMSVLVSFWSNYENWKVDVQTHTY